MVYRRWCDQLRLPRCTSDHIQQFNTCFSNSVFAPNAIIGASPTYASAKWPAGNYFPAFALGVNFVNYNGGIGGDYHLQASSLYKNKGTDGKDLGADIDALNSAIAGVD